MRPSTMWGKSHEEKLTLNELIEKLVEESSMLVDWQFGPDRKLREVHMEIFGPLSQIPSLKNAKLPGKNFIANNVLAKLRALDVLYAKSLSEVSLTGAPTFGLQTVILTLMLPDQSRVDEDNALAAIKDWSEEKIKRVGQKIVKPRGWGVGLIPDDAFIRGFAIRGKDLGKSLNHAIVRWRRFSEVDERVKTFFEVI